jgi:hypothetical protein
MDLADVDAARSMLMECAACAKLTAELCWTSRVDWGQQEVAALAGNGSLRSIILYIGSFIVGLSMQQVASKPGLSARSGQMWTRGKWCRSWGWISSAGDAHR